MPRGLVFVATMLISLKLIKRVTCMLKKAFCKVRHSRLHAKKKFMFIIQLFCYAKCIEGLSETCYWSLKTLFYKVKVFTYKCE